MIHIAPSTAISAVAAAVTASATVIRILRPRLVRMSDPFVERCLTTAINFSLKEGERDTGAARIVGVRRTVGTTNVGRSNRPA
ncbi:hypothetical protein GCM10010987_08050 [Bradyrhizobium guangdongense]|uniref:Uncharacterized protein n=1 Tax=Bradyrhizobium guangdongense TaxID=1325090 RepID=A0AA87W0Q4_9BRAD|nr:hypothetical protein GCM10010987_08050 [Bradyrhizobium guangdongense]